MYAGTPVVVETMWCVQQILLSFILGTQEDYISHAPLQLGGKVLANNVSIKARTTSSRPGAQNISHTTLCSLFSLPFPCLLPSAENPVEDSL